MLGLPRTAAPVGVRVLTLGIDPGIRGCGVAVLNAQGRLIVACYVRNPVEHGNRIEAVRGMAQAILHALHDRGITSTDVRSLAAEWPQVYAGSKAVGDPNDLPPLAGVGCAFAATLPWADVVDYSPREWTGQVEPNPRSRRILKRLDAGEQAMFEGLPKFLVDLARAEKLKKSIKDLGSKEHNTCDAVGIALKAAGRFEPVRVFDAGPDIDC